MVECKLKEIMFFRKIKQTELSKLAGVSRETINQIANGKTVPSVEVAVLIAAALGMKVEDIWSIKQK